MTVWVSSTACRYLTTAFSTKPDILARNHGALQKQKRRTASLPAVSHLPLRHLSEAKSIPDHTRITGVPRRRHGLHRRRGSHPRRHHGSLPLRHEIPRRRGSPPPNRERSRVHQQSPG